MYCSCKSCTLFKSNDTIVLKEKERSCFICCIIWNCDRVALCDICKVLLLARVDSERLVVDAACICKMCALLFVEWLKVWYMYCIVCIDLAWLNNCHWKYIIFKYLDLKVVALLLKDRLNFLEYFCMRCRWCGYRDLCNLWSACVCFLIFLLAAACCKCCYNQYTW